MMIPAKNNTDRRKVFTLHITQNNTIDDLMDDDMQERISEHRPFIALETRKPFKYLATLIFETEEERKKFYEEFQEDLDMEIEEQQD